MVNSRTPVSLFGKFRDYWRGNLGIWRASPRQFKMDNNEKGGQLTAPDEEYDVLFYAFDDSRFSTIFIISWHDVNLKYSRTRRSFSSARLKLPNSEYLNTFLLVERGGWKSSSHS